MSEQPMLVMPMDAGERGTHYLWWCEGCKTHHVFDDRWEYNGDAAKPTFSPSLLTRWESGPDHIKCACHVFVRDGQVQYLDDCTHVLAGQTRPLLPSPGWDADTMGADNHE